MSGGIVVLVPQAHGSVAMYVTNEPDVVQALKKIGKPSLLGPTQETQTYCIYEALDQARKLPGPDPILD